MLSKVISTPHLRLPFIIMRAWVVKAAGTIPSWDQRWSSFWRECQRTQPQQSSSLAPNLLHSSTNTSPSAAHYHENSKYCSANPSMPNKEVDHSLPHSTIQMPVFKEFGSRFVGFFASLVKLSYTQVYFHRALPFIPSKKAVHTGAAGLVGAFLWEMSRHRGWAIVCKCFVIFSSYLTIDNLYVLPLVIR